jgi:hypothetical protein
MPDPYDLIVRNAKVATAGDLFDCDLGIAGGRIVAMAERLQRVSEIDRWVIKNVFAWMRANPDVVARIGGLSINISGQSAVNPLFLKAVLAAGARLAEPGEFTKRAFLNGLLDLAQAEAVADLIASESEAAHRSAMQQMRGGFSMEIKRLTLTIEVIETTIITVTKRGTTHHEEADISAHIDLHRCPCGCGLWRTDDASANPHQPAGQPGPASQSPGG